MKRLYVEIHTRDTSFPVYDESIEIADLMYAVEGALMQDVHTRDILKENMFMLFGASSVDIDGVDVNLAVVVHALIEDDTPEGERICENYLEEVIDNACHALETDGEYILIGGNDLRFRLMEVEE